MTTDGWISALDVRPDGRVLVVGRQRGCIQIWDLIEGRLIGVRLERAESRIMAVSFSPDGAYLAAVTEEGTLTLWDGASFNPIERVEAEPSGALGVAFDRQGSLVATLGRSGEAHLWDPTTGALVYCTAKSNDGGAYSLTFLEEMLVVGHENGLIATWREHAQKQRGPELYGLPGGVRAFGREVYALASSGELVAAGGNQGGGVLLFQGSGDWPCIARIKVPRPMAVNAVAISPDHQHVAAACSDGVVRVADFGGYLTTLCDPVEMTFLATLRASPGDHATRLVYADWLEQAGQSARAELLRHFAGQPIVSEQRKVALSKQVADLWEARVDPRRASSTASSDRGEPSVLHEETLGSEVHRDWTSDAIVSRVAFVGPSIIVSGHFDGAVRFWFKKGALSFMLEATLRLEGTGAKLIAYEGLGEHEREAAWSSLFR